MAVLGYLEEVAPADSEQVVDDGDGDGVFEQSVDDGDGAGGDVDSEQVVNDGDGTGGDGDSEQVVDDGDGAIGNGDPGMDGYYVGDLMQLLQIMVEKGLANALERRCGGGEHCCRFQSISYVYSIFCGISLMFGFLFVSDSFRSDFLLFFVLPV